MLRISLLVSTLLLLSAGTVATQAAEIAGPRTTFAPASNQSVDHFKSYRFLILMDGRAVAGVNAIGGLDGVSPDVAEYRAGDDHGPVLKIPGTRKFGDITLKRGVIQDSDFWNWLKNVKGHGKRRDLTIVLRDEAGNPVQRWTLHRAWVGDYQALPDLDAGANAIAIEHIKLENEGWERDVLPPRR
jgi:phage tail-like protein